MILKKSFQRKENDEMKDEEILLNEIEEELEDLEGAKDGIEEDFDEDQEEDEVIEIDFKNKTVKLNMLCDIQLI